MLYFLYHNLQFSLPIPTSLLLSWYCYNQKQSSDGVLQKKVPLEVSQSSQEKICSRVSFLMKFQIYSVYVYQKELAQMFSCEFCKISNSNFFIKLFWRLLLHIYSFCFLSHHYICPFQKRCHLGLICILGTRVSSIIISHHRNKIKNE